MEEVEEEQAATSDMGRTVYQPASTVSVGPGTDNDTTTTDSDDDVTSFIVNGVDALPNAYPWQASLQVMMDYVWVHVCGGALVARDTVLIAGHCMHRWGRDRHRIALGWHNLTLGEGNSGSQVIEVKDARIHPEFDLCSLTPVPNDIAVLTLERKAVISPAVDVIEIAEAWDEFVDQECTITGWGVADPENPELSPILQAANVSVISLKLCRQLWRAFPGTIVTNTMLCTLDWPTELSASCQGDSGGAVVCDNKVAGIISFSLQECNGCFPDVSTRVASYNRFFRG